MRTKTAKLISALAMAGVLAFSSTAVYAEEAVSTATAISRTGTSAPADSSVTTEAQTNAAGNNDNGGISPLAVKPPNNSPNSGETSLPYTARPYPIYAGGTCYTLYYFKTTTGKLTLNYHLYATQPAEGERQVEFELLEGKKEILWNVSWTTVASRGIRFYDDFNEDIYGGQQNTFNGTIIFSGLKKDTMYCIAIKNITPDDPYGGEGHENAVCGTVDITE